MTLGGVMVSLATSAGSKNFVWRTASPENYTISVRTTYLGKFEDTFLNLKHHASL
jgi:hypothetical protein